MVAKLIHIFKGHKTQRIKNDRIFLGIFSKKIYIYNLTYYIYIYEFDNIYYIIYRVNIRGNDVPVFIPNLWNISSFNRSFIGLYLTLAKKFIIIDDTVISDVFVRHSGQAIGYVIGTNTEPFEIFVLFRKNRTRPRRYADCRRVSVIVFPCVLCTPKTKLYAPEISKNV